MSNTSDIHGGLLALTQLSDALSSSPEFERPRQEVRYNPSHVVILSKVRYSLS
jgi:hypothetical protein